MYILFSKYNKCVSIVSIVSNESANKEMFNLTIFQSANDENGINGTVIEEFRLF